MPRARLPLSGGWLTVPGRGKVTIAARTLNTLGWGATSLYILTLVLGLQRSSGQLTSWQSALAHLAAAAPVGLVALRAATLPQARSAWWWVVAALGLNVWANLLTVVLDPALDPINQPGWRDVFCLPSYVAMFIGVVLLTQRGVGRVQASARLDGITAGLGAAAAISAIFLRSLLTLDGGPLAMATNLAYPMGDLVLLIVLLAGLAPRNYRPTWSSGLLMAGVAVCASGDVAHLLVDAERTYVGGSVLDATWLIGFGLIGLSAWAPARHRKRVVPSQRSLGLLVVPAAFALVALGVISASPFATVPPLASVLAVATLALALGRTLITVRELRTLHESHEQSRIDELTQLPNRRAFFEQLDARLSSPMIAHAVMIVDLDGFKDVNDTFGHQAGDDLLRLVAGRLRHRLPEHVAFARLGGDEFAAVAPVATAEEAETLGRTITRALTEPFALEAATVKVGASCGVSLQGTHGTGRSDLLHAADVAMYEAKRGRAGVMIYDPERDPNSPQRLALLDDLKEALAGDGIHAYYQPIVQIGDGALCGVEALARWHHPRLGVLGPERFMPIVEQANLGTQLTRTMLAQAVAFASGLYRQGLPLVVNVNISVNDLLDDALAELVAELLVTYSLPAQLLTVEITEHALVEERERAERCLSALAARGVGIAVDDFGTGRQPLTDLARLRVHELKLHRSLVTPLGKDSSTLVVVESLTHLARRLGINLVGIGVEDEAALGVLASLGCSRAQGFLVSKPLDPHRLLRHLARYFQPQAAAPGPEEVGPQSTVAAVAQPALPAAAQTVVTLPG